MKDLTDKQIPFENFRNKYLCEDDPSENKSKKWYFNQIIIFLG